MARRYRVIVRRPAKHQSEGNTVAESHEVVNAKPHALNLARKILREDGVPWVEVEEEKGRFRFRITPSPDGKFAVSGSAAGDRMKYGLISAAGWAALASWILFVAATASVGSKTPTDSQVEWIGVFGLAAILLTVSWVYGRVWYWREKMRARAWREGLGRDKRD